MSKAKRQRGNALIEFSLLLPWYFLLFTGVFDFGFYVVGLIGVQNAVRVAAAHTSANSITASDQLGACTLAIEQLRALPNIGSSYSGSCGSGPLILTATYCDGSTPCQGSTDSVDGGPATYVTVSYQVPPMFMMPIGRVQTISMSAEQRLRDLQQ